MARMGLEQGRLVGRGGGPGGKGGIGDQEVGTGDLWPGCGREQCCVGTGGRGHGPCAFWGRFTCVVLLQLDCMGGQCVKAHLLFTHLWTC